MADSPGSPLSSIASDEFAEDVKTEDLSISGDTYVDHDGDTPIERPKKKRRTMKASAEDSMLEEPQREPTPFDTDISSDSDGSVPGSPALGFHQDEEAMGAEQITICKWEGCDAGDLGNMDNLVNHIHEAHIGAKRAKYSCEWGDCARKGTAHASGYALRAHMRSHTREKPFYCLLPECDRSFTRSDALAKHMRTVHETEPPRPSDPVPKHHPSHPSHLSQSGIPGSTTLPTSSKPTRLRLVVNQSGKASGSLPSTPTNTTGAAAAAAAAADGKDPDEEDPSDLNNIAYIPGHHPVTGQAGYMIHWPPDIQFTEHEKMIRADQLRQLLHRQLAWAREEGDGLKKEVEELERRYREEWVKKEALLENVMEAEEGVGEVVGGNEVGNEVGKMREGVRRLEYSLPGKEGEEPWFRKERVTEGDPTLMAAKELLEMRAGAGRDGDEKMGGMDDTT
ncbi:MAG: hypothetical protein M1820_006858 [Bogoriella megaspora]|nr:MAG: hypothetical protein M1820_006858 [Bogoriella megaspora]